MKKLNKWIGRLTLVLAFIFGIQATMSLLNGQLGPGIMQLVFAMYFVFDYKSDRLSQRIRDLEIIESARMKATIELITNAQAEKEPPTRTPQ